MVNDVLASQAEARIDWAAVTEEAVALLRDYLHIDTTNPPGGEEAGAVFLRDVLARDGVTATLHDAGGGRVSLSARLPGHGGPSARPVVLLSHIDVVPTEPQLWRMDPFSGALVDGVIWGRGALDMKGMGIMELMVLLVAKRHGLDLARDVVLLAVADEEEGGHQGIHHIRRTAPELLDASCVFNEGAYGFSELMGQQATIFGVCPSEKSPCWLTLRTVGEPGHASVPHRHNALARLVRALARVEQCERPTRVTAPVEAMLRTLAAKGLVPADLDPTDPVTIDMLASVNAHLSAITRDTVSLTSVRSGAKHNVIPATAEATLDCRLLPDTNPERFVAELREIIDDPAVDVVQKLQHDSGISSWDTPVTRVITEVVAERFGDEAFVLPLLSPAFTDSHAYRAAGVPAYGFTPALLSREDLATIHGHDERISTANLRLGTEMLFEVVRRLAQA